ncbi:LysM peptidoglycan-binding domain-containing protein [Microvirga roseola]|uniref:LysM peptidoglycan-binding domain-containing protein n=1 Tax=Microvirga roseola TaxID=2883126 RepID=UPI001E5392B0|nr:LysM peptidoglycan-binding domain-containing protein [Microvirga roseola]
MTKRNGNRPQTHFGLALLAFLCTGPVIPAVAQTTCGDQVQVRQGDTMFSIAERCNTSVGALRRANPEIDPLDMRVGLYLHVPGGSAPETNSASRQYTFRAGDTLYSIADVLGTTVDAVLEANPSLDPADVPIGTVIQLPRDGGHLHTPDPAEASVSISPDQGEVGTWVEISASGFPPEVPVKIGGGPPNSEYRVIDRMRVGQNGGVQTVVRLPEAAADNVQWVFVVATQDNRVKAVSERFEVIGGDDGNASGVRVTGTLSREGVECPALRSDDGKLYTLAGDTGRFSAGDRVKVRGEVAQASVCQQGTTIKVQSIQQAG